MSEIKISKLVTIILFVTFFIGGCSVHTNRVDRTIPILTSTNSKNNSTHISVYRVDEFVSSEPILIYEDQNLVGEVAGGEALSWKTKNGTKIISTKYGKSEKCFMLNFPCIFNSEEIAKPDIKTTRVPSNSLSIETDTQSRYSLLLEPRSFSKKGTLKVVSEEFAKTLPRNLIFAKILGLEYP